MLSFQNALVTDVQVYTDALDTELAEEIKNMLLGVPFDLKVIAKKLEETSRVQFCEIAEYIRTLEV